MSETQAGNEEIKAEAKDSTEEVLSAEGIQNVSEEAAEDNVEQLHEEVDTEKKELEEFKEKFYYLAAEMENMKKRQERDLENTRKYGSERILKGLLDVVDNLERTLQAIENDEDEKVKNIYVGVDMVKKQFMDTLTQNGLEQVDAIGQKFDPNFHEAMAQQPAEGKEDQEIVQVFQQGYKLNGRLLRAAKVVIVKN